MQKVLFDCAAPTQFAARCNGGHGPISHLGFRALSKSLVSWAPNARCVGSFDALGEDAMKGCRIEIALKTRPRMSLLVAAAVTLSGAFFSAQAQEPIKIGFGVSLTGGLASSGKAHLMSKQIWAEEINAKGGCSAVRSSSSTTTTRPTPRPCPASTRS